MKKEYVKPAIAVEEFLVETVMMNTSSASGGSMGVVPDEEEDGDYSNNRRGWGSLWN